MKPKVGDLLDCITGVRYVTQTTLNKGWIRVQDPDDEMSRITLEEFRDMRQRYLNS